MRPVYVLRLSPQVRPLACHSAHLWVPLHDALLLLHHARHVLGPVVAVGARAVAAPEPGGKAVAVELEALALLAVACARLVRQGVARGQRVGLCRDCGRARARTHHVTPFIPLCPCAASRAGAVRPSPNAPKEDGSPEPAVPALTAPPEPPWPALRLPRLRIRTQVARQHAASPISSTLLRRAPPTQQTAAPRVAGPRATSALVSCHPPLANLPPLSPCPTRTSLTDWIPRSPARPRPRRRPRPCRPPPPAQRRRRARGPAGRRPPWHCRRPCRPPPRQPPALRGCSYATSLRTTRAAGQARDPSRLAPGAPPERPRRFPQHALV